MASSRNMRRSHRASPTNISTLDSTLVKNEAKSETNQENLSEEWTEPPLRAPAPSFEDYKGLERLGVLEHMAPLGSLPNSKVKARLKQHDPPRRAAHLKNGELKAARDEVDTPEPAPCILALQSENRNTDEQVAKVSSSRERDQDYEYIPTLKGNAKAVPPKTSPIPTALHGTPSSRTAPGRVKLKQIVDSAVKRSNELGDRMLGDAVKELYQESLRNPAVADLLDAVLTQRPSPEQTAEFQSRIRAFKKKRKESQAGQTTSSTAVSKSPATKSTRSSVTSHLDTSKIISPPPVFHLHSTNTNLRSSKHHPDTMEVNGRAHPEERPSKRIKRSGSASSDSSLSSLDSAIDGELPPSINANSIPNQKLPHSKASATSGPRLGTFPTRPTDPSIRRPVPLHANSLTPIDDAAVRKREEMRKKFNQFVSVKESAVRSSPSPLYSPHSTPPIATLTGRHQPGRSRNGTSQRRDRDDYEALDSPASSNFGELLIPPPPGATRGGTPNQLGRPQKGHKKGARIKITPSKKRVATTAGRGAEGENVITSSGRITTTTQTDGNSEVCAACSGHGKLLCCEGCTRAFHFTCCDPPIEKDPAGDWYCNKCAEDRAPQQPPSPGIFQSVLTASFKKNPCSYTLPLSYRSYFEGVLTGEEGEYEELSLAKSNKIRGGYEEAPNNFKIKDSKDKTIFCFKCSGSTLPKRQSDDIPAMGSASRGGREMVQCDFCDLSWHLDCIDPPLAVAPRKTKTYRWMCPNHIDSQLDHIDPKANISNKDRPTLGRQYRIRRPKVVSIIDIAMSRGYRNNGLIEIANEESEDEQLVTKTSGQIPRLSENGIKLDFIDRAKRARKEAAHRAAVEDAVMKSREDADTTPFFKRPFIERKAALNMTQMAHTTEVSISPDKVQNLISTLIAEAPEDVEQLAVDDENRADVTPEERKDLEALIKLAQHRLAGGRVG